MKFRGHETFYLRKGWLNKGLKNLKKDPMIFSQKSSDAMDTLGIGSNMIKSLKYWLEVFNFIDKPNRQKKDTILTNVAEIVYKNDPYLEEIGSLLLLQYHLVRNEDKATSWFYFFNMFPLKEFTKEDFLNHISKYIALSAEQVSERSLSDDWNCLLNTYYMRHGKADRFYAENNIESPLQELKLINCIDTKKKVYAKTAYSHEEFPLEIAMYIIVSCFPNKTEIRLEEFVKRYNSIPKAFNFDFLNSVGLLEKLDKYGYIKFIKTAGLDVIKLNDVESDVTYLNLYYENLKGRG